MEAPEPSRIAFGIMCKAPINGASKTRLCPPLTPAEAAQLSRCFIADVASALDSVSAEVHCCGIAVYTPAGEESAFEGLLPQRFGMLLQRGADLGERLLGATEDLLAAGFAGVCLINSDSPTLPAALLKRTVQALHSPGDRIVLGPAIDGGYYLIGLKHPYRPLFDGIPWSTNKVLAQTLARAAALRLPVAVLPPWYDVDDAGTLQLLLHELFGHGVALATDGVRGSPAASSRAYLQSLLLQEDDARLRFAGLTAAR
jgi:rSAM/selenodomain-associated transferase 1